MDLLEHLQILLFAIQHAIVQAGKGYESTSTDWIISTAQRHAVRSLVQQATHHWQCWIVLHRFEIMIERDTMVRHLGGGEPHQKPCGLRVRVQVCDQHLDAHDTQGRRKGAEGARRCCVKTPHLPAQYPQTSGYSPRNTGAQHPQTLRFKQTKL